MSKSLEINTSVQGSQFILQLSGPMNEDANYPVEFPQGVDEVIIDFKNVTLINSTGIQRWIQFFSHTPDHVQVSFVNCVQRIVNQINLFPGFMAGKNVKVLSFYAPYYSESEDESYDLLLKVNEDFPNGYNGAPQKTSESGEELEFDGIEKKYFHFLMKQFEQSQTAQAA
jgi:anti-anti-sigma regulatory factor